ncbi:gamma-glutamylcyclotransferase [Fredinandcohnia sp. 179-A 10B2 NHS]|uniref:gamma-glutamylcyclotransferase family protein n=1 Tax=Fredinandcohnia sp. 179-A 10B2 NHS TaxID=3235176 RepID=UPI0039A235D4
MNKVFVYGTLRKGEKNHYLLKESVCLSDNCWVFGELHDTGYGYPVLKPSTISKVIGEVYEVNDEILQRLDVLEGYTEGSQSNLYERICQVVYQDGPFTEAFVYVTGSHLQERNHKIESGDWKTYRK